MIDFKELPRLILQGWCDRNNTAEDERQPLEHYYEQLTPVEDDAHALALFSEWANDLMSIYGSAAHIRLTIEVSDDGKWTVQDVPDPVIQANTTLDDYYWSCGTYEWDAEKQDMVWRGGEWRLCLEAQDRLEGRAKHEADQEG